MAMDGDINLGALDPAGLDKVLDPLPDAVTALETCQAFLELVETFPPTQPGYDSFHLNWLGPKYRVLEWEIFVRDLDAADARNPLQYYFASHRKRTSDGPLGLLLPRPARLKLLENARSPSMSTNLRADEIDQDIKSFARLGPERVRLAYPRIHHDLFRLLVRRPAGGHRQSAMLLEDGELTFYSLLWLLRRVGSDGTNDWCNSPEDSRLVRLDSRSGDPQWAHATLHDLLEQCGVIIVIQGQYLPTQRWHSLCDWIRQTATLAAAPVKGSTAENSDNREFATTMALGFQTILRQRQ